MPHVFSQTIPQGEIALNNDAHHRMMSATVTVGSFERVWNTPPASRVAPRDVTRACSDRGRRYDEPAFDREVPHDYRKLFVWNRELAG